MNFFSFPFLVSSNIVTEKDPQIFINTLSGDERVGTNSDSVSPITGMMLECR